MDPKLLYHANRLRQVLTTRGIGALLHYLNERTAYRYTGVFQFEGADVRNLFLHDRTNQEAPLLDRSPMPACPAARPPLAPIESLRLGRIPPLPQQPRDGGAHSIAPGYCGHPIVVGTDRLFGSIAHFDPMPRELDSRELRLLEVAAGLVGEHLSTDGWSGRLELPDQRIDGPALPGAPPARLR